MLTKTHLLAGAVLALLIAGSAAADPLRDGFRSPPESARPRVWWHWMNGNISKEGITLDLEWMKRVGIGGVQTFDANLGTPQVVDKRLVFMSPEWKAAFRYAASEADRLGLELAIASSPGWSETGGPWVEPAQAMKKLVWSETRVAGGRRFAGPLAPPPLVSGPFQDVPMTAGVTEGPADPRTFYRDAVVVAFRAPPALAVVKPAVTSNAALDAAALSDGDLAKVQVLKPAAGDPSVWIRFDYATPREVGAVRVAYPGPRGFGAAPLPVARLEASQDGASFTPVADLAFGGAPQQTVAFAPVRAAHFRVVFSPAQGGPPSGPAPAPGVVMPSFGPPASGYGVSELTLEGPGLVNRFEEKAGFGAARDYDAIPTPRSPGAVAIAAADVVDLTARMRPDGTLDWTPPKGDWIVLRMGYSLTGHKNGPASPEGTGLEVDKLNRAHVAAYLDTYLGMYRQAAGADLFGAKGLNALLNDSIESWAQNWTEDMLDQFKQRRGYDARPWLPALTGRVVGDAEASDRFLWDFRRTIAELYADSHYGAIAEAAKADGLTLYGEALEDRRPQLGDDLEMRKRADVPMAAMWTFDPAGDPAPSYVADTMGAASVAHIWGQNLAAAESMTAFGRPWAFAPRDLKPTVDREFALGINRIVIHTSAHQPLVDQKPGLALAPFLGQYFTRNETWADQAGPWIDYIARSSYLLQQGHAVADVAWFYGEEGPLTSLYGDGPIKDLPAGHGVDFVNADALLHRLSVKDGRLVTPSGMSYRLLYLGGASGRMTVATLRRLRELAADGAVIVGSAPAASRSLADDPAAFATLVAELWPAAASGPQGAVIGKGRVLAGRTAGEALAVLGDAPDAAFDGATAGAKLAFVHRRLDDGDLYYVSNGGEQAETVDARFRVSGKAAEIWRADTGAATDAAYRIDGVQTVVPLKLAPHDAVFVVFRKAAAQPSRAVSDPTMRTVAAIDGPWTLSFQPGRGAPAAPVSAQTGSWTNSADPGVRYFSGTATYRRTIKAPKAWFDAGSRLVLDLGEVREIAEVSVNGRSLGTGWKPPFRFDVTDALKPGDNLVEVKVTNLWVNRLIGDEQPGAKRIASTTGQTYSADAPLRPSGLIGPVVLLSSPPD